MKKTIIFLLLLPCLSNAQTKPATDKSHCIFIGTNTGRFQLQGNYIIAIGNYKEEVIFRDSSINIDRAFPYFQTPRGKVLLAYIENNYLQTTTLAFFNNLQELIKKYYLSDLEHYIRSRRYEKTFYAFN